MEIVQYIRWTEPGERERLQSNAAMQWRDGIQKESSF